MHLSAPTQNSSADPNVMPAVLDIMQFHERTWFDCLKLIKARVNNQSFKAWFEPIIPLRLNDGKFSIQVPSQFFSEWLEEHYFSLMSEVLTQVTGTEIVLEYEVVSEDRETRPSGHIPSPYSPESPAPISTEPARFSADAPRGSANAPMTKSPAAAFLNPSYTFQHYIRGESNQFASAAALAVANTLGGSSFNPLVIYGGVGLGKTHLVHAIGNHVMQTDRSRRGLYVSSEKITIDFVEAIHKEPSAGVSQ